MYCRQCGKENPADSRFCMHCGNPFPGEGLTIPGAPAPAQPDWEYKDFVLDYSQTGLGARMADEALRSTFRLELWANVRSTVMQNLQAWLEQGWQPVASIGPDCLEFKDVQRREVGGGMALFGVNTYMYLQAVRIQMRRLTPPRPQVGTQADLNALQDAARKHVTTDMFYRAAKALPSFDSSSDNAETRETLQYFGLTKDISEFFRRRYLNRDLKLDKAKIEQDLHSFQKDGLKELLKAYLPITEIQKQNLCYRYKGLRQWLEDELLFNLFYGARMLKIHVSKEDLFWINKWLENPGERLDRTMDRVLKTEETAKQNNEAIKRMQKR